MRSARTKMGIWSYLNEGRRKKTQNRESIRSEDGKRHFNSTLSNKEKRSLCKKRNTILPQKDTGKLQDIEMEEQMVKQKTGEAIR